MVSSSVGTMCLEGNFFCRKGDIVSQKLHEVIFIKKRLFSFKLNISIKSIFCIFVWQQNIPASLFNKFWALDFLPRQNLAGKWNICCHHFPEYFRGDWRRALEFPVGIIPAGKSNAFCRSILDAQVFETYFDNYNAI